MGIYEDIQKANKRQDEVMKSFFSGDSTPELMKKISDDIEKGGKAGVLGEIREWGGKKYHKTPKGWRPVSTKGNKVSTEEVNVSDDTKKVLDAIKELTVNGNTFSYHRSMGRGGFAIDNPAAASSKELPSEIDYDICELIKKVEANPDLRPKLESAIKNWGFSKIDKIKYEEERIGGSTYRTYTFQISKGEAFIPLSKGELLKVDDLHKEIDQLKKMMDDSYYMRRAGLTYEEVKERKKDLQDQFNKLLKVGDLNPSYWREGMHYFLSPGPMRISKDHPHVEYSFGRIRNDKDVSTFNIPDAEKSEKMKKGRQEVLESAKKGTLAWWTPSGYHFGVKFTKNDKGNTEVSIQGRPSSAVGKSPQFESYEIKGWDINDQKKELMKFDTIEKVQKYMRQFQGKSIKWV